MGACSGGGGGESRMPQSAAGPDASSTDTGSGPSLRVALSPPLVAAGDTSRLRWKSGNARSCEASGGWDGHVGTTGTVTVGPVQETTQFRLSCSGPGGGVSRTVTLKVAEAGDISIDLAISKAKVGRNESVTLSWTTLGATSCSATGGWTGERALAGSYRARRLRGNTTFNLSCSNGQENELASVSVEVLSKVLEWAAPTHNVDGTPLTDLAGYVIYWGRDSRRYTGSHRIHSPRVTRWVAKIPPGIWRFALTAIDRQGNESDYSNEIEKLIP